MALTNKDKALAWFDRFTNIAFGYVLLAVSSVWLPFGLHRFWFRQKGWKSWWCFTATYLLAAVGLSEGVKHYRAQILTGNTSALHYAVIIWLVSSIPYAFLFFFDALTLWNWKRPVATVTAK